MFNRIQRLPVCTLLLTALSAPAAFASQPYANDTEGASARDFIADESRVGSLAGTLIGGALTAHPAGTVLGAVVGYVVGKKSDFTPDEDERRAAALGAQAVPGTGVKSPSAPANPLVQCFGERSMQARAKAASSEEGEAAGVAAKGGDPVMLSLVSLQPVSGSGSSQSAAAAKPAPLRLASTDRRRRSPCFYYSSW